MDLAKKKKEGEFTNCRTVESSCDADMASEL